MKFVRIVVFGLAGLALGACQSTNVAPLSDANVPLEKDEREILGRVRAQESNLLRSGFVVRAPEVDGYLDSVLARLHPQPLPGDFRLQARVIADPSLNAFVLPNGAMFVHSGLLARLENEAQLATILGHELNHAVLRHSLKSYRSMKNHATFANSLYIGGGGSVFTLLTSLGALSSAMGYSRDLEREADVTGFQLVVAAGYDPRECLQVFRVLLEQTKREDRKEAFFFGSHPRLAERSANFRELIASLPEARRETGQRDSEQFVAMLPEVLRINARAALQKGDLDAARDSAQRALQLRADDAQALYFLGEIHRRRTATAAPDRAEAQRFYREALAHAPELAEAHRGLGLELMKAGERSAAAEALRRYLELAPDAHDRPHIQEFIRQCETSP